MTDASIRIEFVENPRGDPCSFCGRAGIPTCDGPTVSICAHCASLAVAVLEGDNPWRPMSSAPKDGTLIDLMYPHPRGRTIDCRWKPRMGWHWLTPAWPNGPDGEIEWQTNYYPNMQPLAWMPCPPNPEGPR